MRLDENVSYTFFAEDFMPALKRAKRYALISLPWTVNRMAYAPDKHGMERRLRNIILGKLPEYLMPVIFRDYGLFFDATAGETDFWKRDNFDFLLTINGHKEEWDLKCLTLSFNKMKSDDWLKLPALIPDRHKHDQWAKRNTTIRSDSFCKRYLFAYMDTPRLNIRLNDEQTGMYRSMIAAPERFKRQDDFILRSLGDIAFDIDINILRLVLSAVAGPNEWSLFKTIPANSNLGLIHTRIQNKGTAIAGLPSFLKITGRTKTGQ